MRYIMKKKYLEDFRIIWAITAKDLIDGLKNNNVIAVIIPALFVLLLYRFLPAITSEDKPPALLVYDAGNPTIMTLLEDSPAVDLYSYDTEAQMLKYLSNGEQPELGLVIPVGFDQLVERGQSLVLQGYMLHFFSDQQISELQQYMQDEFEYLLKKPVDIHIGLIQLQPETHGITILASMGFGFAILMIGMIAIPHMMLEEKQNKTLDAILISPASNLHVIAGKALTGLIYCLVVYVGGLFLFRMLIVHWGIAFLAGLFGACFAISLGLLLGILVDTRQKLVLWAWVGLIPVFLPMMLSVMGDLLPAWLIVVVNWVPSSALMRVIRSTMISGPPVELYVPQLAILLVSSVLFLAVDVWLVHRLDC
jgi:ABC-2 type transport system permease protein